MLKKGIFSSTLSLFMILPLFGQKTSQTEALPENSNEKIDYTGFLMLGDSLSQLRQSRLIDEKTFIRYSQDEHTIILDTRSKEAFDDIHVAGAIHLNFSDFTEQKLAQKIPHKHTRILIYCNNNFESPRLSLANKRVDLALNVPTFINLHGYGYENVYELGEYLKKKKPRFP